MNGHGTPTNAAKVALHAAERWMQRVDRGASIREANFAVQRFVALGRVRPTCRHWMRGRVRQEPGTVFVYNAERPDVCAVVVQGVVVTVLTRALFTVRPKHLAPVASAPRPVSAMERAKWRWSGDVVESDEAA